MEPPERLRRSTPKRPAILDRDRLDSEKTMAEQEIHIGTEKARAGATPHIVRYVLGISLALVILAMAIILGAK
jgi:hypothetical protein